MAGKTKQSEPKMRLDLRAKMYIVLVICSLMLLASVGVAFFLVGGFGSSEDAASDSAVEPESIITESGYNKEENTIDTTAYSATILPESSDAGQTYVDETLFLGDSNTARMYRMFDFCTYDNAIGSVGMSAKSLATYACVELNNSGSYVTMAKAVAGPSGSSSPLAPTTSAPATRRLILSKTTRQALRASSRRTPVWTSSSTPFRRWGSSTPTRA